MNTIVGSKYYRYTQEGGLEIIRLKKIKNQDTIIVQDRGGKKFTLTDKELNNYTRLNPDGYVSFAIVSVAGGVSDVIVGLHRKKDIEEGSKIPYAVCRQNVFDFFANQTNRDESITLIGTSVSKDTCPPDVDYRLMLACDGLMQLDTVNVYIDDTFEDVISMINTVNYDNALYTLDKKIDKEKTIGACSSLKQLLTENRFWNEFYRAFNIIKINEVIMAYGLDVDGDRLPQKCKEAIESVTKYEILNELVMVYDKDIDLTAAQRDYLLVCDGNNVTHIVIYTKGNYTNKEYLALADQSEKVVLLDNKNLSIK